MTIFLIALAALFGVPLFLAAFIVVFEFWMVLVAVIVGSDPRTNPPLTQWQWAGALYEWRTGRTQ